MATRLTITADLRYRRALDALDAGDHERAAGLFHSVIETSRRGPLALRALSYYGVSLARGGWSSQVALDACKQAVAQRADDPVLLLNLGHVYRKLGKVPLALRALESGLRLDPDHAELRRELALAERRKRRPPLAFLSRSHALNRWLGQRFRRGKRAWNKPIDSSGS